MTSPAAMVANAPIPRGIDPQVIAAVTQGPVDALVYFDDRPARAGASAERFRRNLAENDETILDANRAAIAQLKSQAGPLDVVRDYPNLGIQLVRFASDAELQAAFARPGVASIRPAGKRQKLLGQSLALIRQPEAQAAGYTGAGVGVAVLDTGVDYLATGFNCTGLNSPAGTCKVVYAQDFATNDGQRDDDGHGTNVAAIVVGVAPSVRIISLDVFQGSTAYDPDILEAIDWVITNRATYNIRAINLSLGDVSRNTSACGASFAAGAFAALRDAGILPVVAAGNTAFGGGSYIDGIADPACAPGAVSIGAVYDSNLGPRSWNGCTDLSTAADRVTCFSQSAPILTALAPGAQISAGGLTFSGTSQAAPHAAGVVAVLASANPGAGVAGWESALVSTGKPVLDARNNRTKNRVDVYGAVCSLAPCSGVATSTPSVTRTATPVTPSPTATRNPNQEPTTTATRTPTASPTPTTPRTIQITNVLVRNPEGTPTRTSTPTMTPTAITTATPTTTASPSATATPTTPAGATGWKRVSSPSGWIPLRGLAMPSPDDGWAVGDFGVILYWNGSAWNFVPSSTFSDLMAVAAISSTFAVAAGEGGVALRWNGIDWQDTLAGSSPNLRSITLSPGTTTDGWAGDTVGAVHRWNGSSPINPTQIAPFGIDIRGVSAISSTLAFAVTADGHNRIYRWNGLAWSAVYTATTGLNAIATVGTTAYAVGDGGLIVRFDGSSWAPVASPTTHRLYAVHLMTPTSGWAVGADGAVLRLQGGTWSLFPQSATIDDLFAVFTVSAGEAWAVGDGVILRYLGP
ncbi:MAG: S8 family serine peptidase [Dehalococcoidia bacterium]